METALFILNAIWALLGIATFILLSIFLYSAKKNLDKKKNDDLMNHIASLRSMRDLHRNYGQNAAAKRLDEEIQRHLKDLDI